MGSQIQTASDAMMGSIPASLTGATQASGNMPRQQHIAFDFHIHGLPAGATVTGSPRDNSLGPTRVAYSMPTGTTP